MMMDEGKKYIIFGAGLYGKKAFEEYGADRVAGFIDNSPQKQGKFLYGKRIMRVEDILPQKENYHIVLASLYVTSMEKQLKELGIEDYIVYAERFHRFLDTDELIFNQYEMTAEARTESEWNNSERIKYMRQAVYDEVEELYKKQPLFDNIEVETINRCNGNCSFCPVNQNTDTREKKVMPKELFENIVCQLEEINYSGRFSTYSNNEPLLDERIVEFNQFARKHLPNARMHMFTNGTLLTLDKFIALMNVLDELIIDNYHQQLKLIKPCEQIKEYCESHPELKKKVTISLRKPQEILTSRGGTSPNRKELVEYGKDRCVLPFKQLIIRPDGKISLCCNDALGRFTLGDAGKEKLLDIWYGPRFKMVRKCLYEGRENWGNCKNCDTFMIG